MKPNIKKIKESKSTEDLLNFSIINLDKPTGPTSFWTSQYVKTALKLKKTGHLGTLDPMVTGVLPVALGRACKLNEFLMHRDKTYVGIMRVHKEISEKELKERMKKYVGKINQLPPVKSRVKRAIREREVKKFEILEIQGKDVLFISQVQAGTYIRKLISDLGDEIGGAHMLELRRTQAGFFKEESSSFVNLYDLDKALEEHKKGNDKLLREILIPAEEAILQVLPSVQVKETSIKALKDGKPLMKQDIETKLPSEEIFAVFHKNQFIEIAKTFNEDDIIAKPLFVFN